MGLPPSIRNDIISFDQNISYNSEACVTVTRRNIGTNKSGFETVITIGSILWGKLPSGLTNDK